VSIGNETYDGSFNDADIDVTVPDPAVPAPADQAPDPVDQAPAPDPVDAAVPVDVVEPAYVLDTDMAAAEDSYDADAASASVADEPSVDEPLEED
jgi:hypothetical protein